LLTAALEVEDLDIGDADADDLAGDVDDGIAEEDVDALDSDADDDDELAASLGLDKEQSDGELA
jgi:ATP-dependent RNA helicase DHX37/DHR1